MGEISEMMLDGTLCECCGTFLGDAEGFVRRCSACQREEKKDSPLFVKGKIHCFACGKAKKLAGMKNHLKDAHGVSEGFGSDFLNNFFAAMETLNNARTK